MQPVSEARELLAGWCDEDKQVKVFQKVIPGKSVLAQFSSVQFRSLSCVRLFATPWTAARKASLSIANSRSLLKLMFIELVMPSNHLCCPLLLPPSISTSIRVFSNESVLHMRWPKYWNFSFSISSSNEYLGLISFRMDWFDLLAVHTPTKCKAHRDLRAQIKAQRRKVISCAQSQWLGQTVYVTF